MNEHPERELADLLRRSVEDVEPADRWAQVRARTRSPRSRPQAPARPWGYALVGAAAVAAVIGGVALAGTLVGDAPGPAGPPAATSSTAPTAPLPGPTSGTEGPARSAIPVYYLVDTERAGVRLVREFRPGPDTGRMGAALLLLEEEPLDPDYRTAWPGGSLLSVSFGSIGGADQFEVEVEASVRERPDGMSAQEARAAVEQVVRTVQAVQQSRAPVRFTLPDGPADQVLGVPTPEPVTGSDALAVLNHLNLTTPEQGSVVEDTLRLSGVANSFEGSVYWQIRRGEDVVADGPATAGWLEERLFPFEEEIDVSDLPPGDYTVWATTDDPTGGAEGIGAMTDSKEFTIR